MSFSLHDIGAAASKKIEDEIASRKREGNRKLLRHEAEQMALKTAWDTYSLDEKDIGSLFFYMPEILSNKTRNNETVRDSIHRIVVHEALKGWKSTIDWNVANQHAPYDVAQVIEVVPKAMQYLNLLCKRNRYYPEVHIDQNWIGLALMYLEDRTPDRLMELDSGSVKEVLSSLARYVDGIAWAIKSAASPANQKANGFHNKLLELMDMLYMICHGQIETSNVIWPEPTR